MLWLKEPIGERKIREESLDANYFAVRQPKYYTFMGCYATFLMGLILVPLWIFRNESIIEESGLGAILPLFILGLIGGIYLLIKRLIWKVEISGNRISYRNDFGRTKEFNFDEIKKVIVQKTVIPGKRQGKFISVTPSYVPTYSKVSVYLEDSKAMTVYVSFEGFFLFVSRLKQEQVPFEILDFSKEEKAHKEDRSHLVIGQPKYYSVVGVVGSLFFVGFIGLAAIMSTEYDYTPWWGYVTFGCFALLNAYLILYGRNWKVEVVGDEIHYRSMFGVTKVFAISEVKEVKNKMFSQQAVLYSDKGKLLAVGWNCKGYHSFLSLLKEKGVAVDRIIGH